MHNYCVILAGGAGSSFWPICRDDHPKQFYVSETSGKSFLQQTYDRMLAIFPEENIYIISLLRYKDLLKEQFPDMPEDRFILEPYGRNTAPATAFAAVKVLARDPDAVMTIIPSDQEIGDRLLFRSTLRTAMDYAASKDVLLALGIIPTSPNTDFGYVQVTGGRDAYEAGKPVKAKTFTEKPSPELAGVFVESGEFLWNSGIFVWKASAILREMHVCSPEITRLWTGWEQAMNTPAEAGFVEKVYTESPNISIDYAVLEKSDNLWVLPARFGWSDVGTFNSYYTHTRKKDSSGNLTSIASGKSLLREDMNDIIWSGNPRKLVVIRGLEDYLVVDTDDVLMICPRDESRMKETLSELTHPGFEEFM